MQPSLTIRDPRFHQHLASQHTPLTFRRGFVRDCGTSQTRSYAARALDRNQTASDVQAGLYYRALGFEQKLKRMQLKMLMDIADDGDEDDMMNLFRLQPTLLQRGSRFHLARANEQLSRPQPPLVRHHLPRFDNVIENYSEEECRLYFRLGKG